MSVSPVSSNVFSPDTKYKFQWGANRNNGNFVLEEAYVTHKLNFAPDLFVKGGQFKDPTFHEEVVFSRHQLTTPDYQTHGILLQPPRDALAPTDTAQ